MLILPLHRVPTRANFPWVTLALLLVNVFVFAALQSGDERIRERALDGYLASDLALQEFPAYARWLAAGDEPANASLFTEMAARHPRLAAIVLNSDARFVAALSDGSVIPPGEKDLVGWKERRAAFERQWNATFTERWLQRFDRFEPSRMLSATFLHANAAHLVGNMIFLVMLGLLVEGALGAGLFLALYLLGGIGASAVSLAFNWGEPGGGLGASGAIAALMGAYCVLWGLRRVRFFWWFFVVFDYVKAPALVLLPFWLGWELFNLAFNGDAGIGFDAHAGGMITGAALAFAVRRMRWERSEFMDEDVRVDQAETTRADLARAREHIGRLEIAQARALLEPVLERDPANIDVLAALYRCARYEKGQPRTHQAAFAVLRVEPGNAVAMHAQKSVFDDYAKLTHGAARVPAALRLALARRWTKSGETGDALRLAAGIDLSGPAGARFASGCFAIAQAAHARGLRAETVPLLESVIRGAPDSVEAGKACVLLDDIAAPVR